MTYLWYHSLFSKCGKRGSKKNWTNWNFYWCNKSRYQMQRHKVLSTLFFLNHHYYFRLSYSQLLLFWQSIWDSIFSRKTRCITWFRLAKVQNVPNWLCSKPHGEEHYFTVSRLIFNVTYLTFSQEYTCWKSILAPCNATFFFSPHGLMFEHSWDSSKASLSIPQWHLKGSDHRD